jgi:hypothetical protein
MTVDPKVLKLIQEIEEIAKIKDNPEYDFKKNLISTTGRVLGSLAGIGLAVSGGIAPYGAMSTPGLLSSIGGGITGSLIADKLAEKLSKNKVKQQ